VSVSEKLRSGVSLLRRRFPESVELEWFLNGLSPLLARESDPKGLEQQLSLVAAALQMDPSQELDRLHGMLWEAERRLSPADERSDRDRQMLEGLAAQGMAAEGFEPTSPEEEAGAFLGEFLNDAVRDFDLPFVRRLWEGFGPFRGPRFELLLPGMMPRIEEMARMVGFFRDDPGPLSFDQAVNRATSELPTLAVGLLMHPMGELQELLGSLGVDAFADAILRGKVSKLAARMQELEGGLRLVRPPAGIAMMQRRLEMRERRTNPGAAIDPNLVGGVM
jgi:hypothetical protein